MPRWSIIRTIIRRDVGSYFSNPTGYIFITVFVALGAFAAFWPDGFFAANLANLDTLTARFHWLMLFFVPAITMGIWADERRQGTEELLLTLPATDLELVAGKYGAAVTTYAIALAFSLTHVLVLLLLGVPDFGLLLSTYVGYLLLGASLIAFGTIGSLFASSPTVGFIYGALLCAGAVFFEDVGRMLTDPGTAMHRFFVEGSVLYPLREAANGVVTLQTLVTALATIAVMVFLGVVVLGARRRGLVTPHGPVRFVAAGVIGLCLSVLCSRLTMRFDLTAERINTLSATTYAVLDKLPDDQPIYVRAFVSPEVPEQYVQIRKELLQILREFDARAGDKLVLEVRATEPYSEASRDAEEQYGITAQQVSAERGGTATTDSIYLGLAFTCGAQRLVLPFMFQRFNPEYEVTRALRVVSQGERKRLGVLGTDAKITGGFDFQSMRQNPEWAVVTVLRQQYEVVEVAPDSDYPANLDVLLAVQPSSLTQPQMDRFQGYVTSGKPVVLIEDPSPQFNLSLSGNEPKGGGRNPFMGGQPPPEPKGDFAAVLRAIGVRLPMKDIVWDGFDPYPRYQFPRELVFIGEGNGAKHPFGDDHVVTRGLQGIVSIYSGHVGRASDSVVFTPLLVTGGGGGVHNYDRLVIKSFMGIGGVRTLPTNNPTGTAYVLAGLARGTLPAAEGQPAAQVNACVIADADMIADVFFRIRENGPPEFTFDNVTFVLNCIDHLAGDERFIELRSRRPQHRRLTEIEEDLKVLKEAEDERTKKADETKDTRLAERQQVLNDRVAAIRERTDIDARQKEFLERQAQEAEQRKFDIDKASIEAEAQRDKYLARTEYEEGSRGVRNKTRFFAMILPPIPALLLGLMVFGARRRRESEITR